MVRHQRVHNRDRSHRQQADRLIDFDERQPGRGPVRPATRQDGQSIVETCFVMGLICLIFMGMFQVSQILAARDILHHAAARGARAKTVGFNWWMVEKAIRVGSIPNAGPLVGPPFENIDPALRSMVDTLRPGDLWSAVLGVVPSSLQYNLERARIPEYLATHNDLRANYILDYRDWDSIRAYHGDAAWLPDGSVAAEDMLHVRVRQDYALWVPMHRTFYTADSVPLEGECYIENHYSLYIDDSNW